MLSHVSPSPREMCFLRFIIAFINSLSIFLNIPIHLFNINPKMCFQYYLYNIVCHHKNDCLDFFTR